MDQCSASHDGHFPGSPIVALPPALERRRIAHPKAQDYADFQRGLQQRFATGEMGTDQIALQNS